MRCAGQHLRDYLNLNLEGVRIISKQLRTGIRNRFQEFYQGYSNTYLNTNIRNYNIKLE